jgi:hypothetical protein
LKSALSQWLRQLIDPGIGTVLAPVAAVSSGLIPQPLKMSASSVLRLLDFSGFVQHPGRTGAGRASIGPGGIDLNLDPGYLSCHMNGWITTGMTTTTERPCDSSV